MRTKRVNRYYCDHCKKAGCSAGHMKKHERRCTFNPNRVCGMCKMMEIKQQDLGSLVALFPEPPQMGSRYETCSADMPLSDAEFAEYKVKLKVTMDVVRERTEGCPACILAARKLAKVPYVEDGFDFRKESDAIFEQRREDARGCY